MYNCIECNSNINKESMCDPCVKKKEIQKEREEAFEE